MIVTLSGENSFNLRLGLETIKGNFVKEHGELALEQLNGAEADYDRLREALTSLPLLAARKMVLLSDPGKNKQFLEDFEQLFSIVPDSTDVIIIEPKLDKRLSYYKFLKKNTDFRDFPELDSQDLSQWLMDTAKRRGGTLSSGNARYLVERLGANQQLLANELEKLLLYNREITRQSIDLLTEPAPSSTIFNLIEAAFAGNSRKVLSLYAEQRALKVEPQQIIAMLAWQLHVLAVIKTAGDRSADQIAKEAGINPFVVRKSQTAAKNLSRSETKKLISDLLQIDIKSKTVSVDLDDALQKYLLDLSTSS